VLHTSMHLSPCLHCCLQASGATARMSVASYLASAMGTQWTCSRPGQPGMYVSYASDVQDYADSPDMVPPRFNLACNTNLPSDDPQTGRLVLWMHPYSAAAAIRSHWEELSMHSSLVRPSES
jgi:hypothetical protein